MPICTTAYFDETYGQPKQVQYSRFNPGLIVFNPTPSVTIAATPAKAVEQKVPVKEKKEKFVWCKGEGDGKTINGKWEQNYGPGLPWIKGFFINGKRSGDWEEYYPGTTTLCRTESWRNNKLNGVRKRFDRSSRLIEEIIFVEGKAVCKTNYDLNDSLTYVRIPQNDSIVATQVYNNQGKLIACGKEQIYNPSGLLWFQNIELTAMNSIQVSSRSTQIAAGSTNGSSFGANGGYTTGGNEGNFTISSLFSGGGFQPSLVEYHKIGTWWYYPEQSALFASRNNGPEWSLKYEHYGLTLSQKTMMFGKVQKNVQYDSLKVEYSDDHIVQFYGYTPRESHIFRYDYYTRDEYYGITEQEYLNNNVIVLYPYYYPYQEMAVQSAGQYDEQGNRLGEWYYYDTSGNVIRKEEYFIPVKDEEIEPKRKQTAAN
jgi:antitoxin component YwqK of YwqJK toxin-antitoxin module